MSPIGGGTLGTGTLGGGVPVAAGVVAPPPPATTIITLVALELHGLGLGWTDVTEDLTTDPLLVTRGFQSASPDDLIAAPSTFAFGLDNSAYNSARVQGYYSPDSAGVCAGFALGIRVRLQVALSSGGVYTRFVGFIQEIHPQPGIFEDQTTSIQAASWLQMASTTLAAGVTSQVNQRGDQLIATLVSLATIQPASTFFRQTEDVFPHALYDLDPASSTIMDGLDSVAKSGLTRIWEQADGTLVIEPRTIRESGWHDQFAVTDIAPPGRPSFLLTAMPAMRTLAALYNRCQITVHPARVDTVPVVLYSYQTTGSPTAITPGQIVVMHSPYVDPSQQAQSVGGFAMIDNAGAGHPGQLPLADYKFSATADGLGADLSAFFTVGVTFAGNEAVFTVQNIGTVSGYLIKLQCRGQGIYDYQVVVATNTATSSQAAMGQQNLSVDCPYHVDPIFAQNAARYMTALLSPTLTQLDQGVQLYIPAGQIADREACLQMEVSTTLAISESVTGLSVGQFWINAVRDEWDERNNLTITLSLARRDPNLYWQLGSAGFGELGLTTALAYI